MANSGWSGPAGVVPGAQTRAGGVNWVIETGRIGRVRQVHTGCSYPAPELQGSGSGVGVLRVVPGTRPGGKP